MSVRNLIEVGSLTAGHARPLIGLDRAEDLAKEIVAKKMSVREAEALARKTSTGSATPRAKGTATARVEKDADTAALEKSISEQLGLKVEVLHTGGEGGEVKVTYKSLEQLDEICRLLAGRGGPKISGL